MDQPPRITDREKWVLDHVAQRPEPRARRERVLAALAAEPLTANACSRSVGCNATVARQDLYLLEVLGLVERAYSRADGIYWRLKR
jgi:predicted ArsR family transcriptional regulator